MKIAEKVHLCVFIVTDFNTRVVANVSLYSWLIAQHFYSLVRLAFTEMLLVITNAFKLLFTSLAVGHVSKSFNYILCIEGMDANCVSTNVKKPSSES